MARPDDSLYAEGCIKHLKLLETSVGRARASICKLDKENGSLREQVRKLKAEKRELQTRTKQLQESAKQSIMSRGRMKLVKARIQEIIQRIEKVEAQGDLARNED